MWVNGDFIPFSIAPELKKVYDDGGFSGMLMKFNASSSEQAANKGKFRPNAAIPTGLYLPVLGDEFSGCIIGREATWPPFQWYVHPYINEASYE